MRSFLVLVSIGLAGCGASVQAGVADGAVGDGASDGAHADAACINQVEGAACSPGDVACGNGDGADRCCVGYWWSCDPLGGSAGSVWRKVGLGCPCASDSGVIDAPVTDAAPACFDDAGAMSSVPFKQCHSDAECAYYTHQTDCCGDTTLIGIASSYATTLGTCEATWDKHFPGCGCPEGPPQTEDGKTIAFGTKPIVKCVDFTSSGGICQTSAP